MTSLVARSIGAASVFAFALLGSAVATAAPPSSEGEALLDAKCSSCHTRSAGDGLFRIDHIRKTPEGWSMTLWRMRQWHGLQVSDDEERSLIKYLADTRGLAPEETAPYRYALERRTLVETPDDADTAVLCARCHSYARPALQRRTEDEWRRLIHMHLAQWPTIEYHAFSRDRKWWEIVSTQLPAKLAAKWPLSSAAWDRWKAKTSPDLSGVWTVSGHRPGKGGYTGRMDVRAADRDHYAMTYRLVWADGSEETGQGSSVVYTGYEWRGSTTLGGERRDEVLTVEPGGNRIAGRWFVKGQEGVGGDMTAVRGSDMIASVTPAYLKRGIPTRITIAGSGLAGTPSLGRGVKISKVISSSPESVTVLAEAARNAPEGPRAVTVGRAGLKDALAVYGAIASVKVEPADMVARNGGNGGPVPTTLAQFEAVAYTGGGQRIGVVPARWSARPFDDTALHDKDVEFGGTLSADGLFTPGDAGPNPKRGGGNNNANLYVVAEVTDGPRQVEGKAHLIIAPQRWNDSPIR